MRAGDHPEAPERGYYPLCEACLTSYDLSGDPMEQVMELVEVRSADACEGCGAGSHETVRYVLGARDPDEPGLETVIVGRIEYPMVVRDASHAEITLENDEELNAWAHATFWQWETGRL